MPKGMAYKKTIIIIITYLVGMMAHHCGGVCQRQSHRNSLLAMSCQLSVTGVAVAGCTVGRVQTHQLLTALLSE
jgi:hypothetical protein